MSGWQPTPATALLILQDGTRLEGRGIGAVGHAAGEVCFNTAMTGYQEILTDPSYAGQRGVEADLADRVAGGAKTGPLQHGSVSQHQQRGGLGLGPSAGTGLLLGHAPLFAHYICRGKGEAWVAPKAVMAMKRGFAPRR